MSFERNKNNTRQLRNAERRSQERKGPRRQSSRKPKRKNSSAAGIVLLVVVLVIAALSLMQFQGRKEISVGSGLKMTSKKNTSAAGQDYLENEEDRHIIYVKPPFATSLSGLDGMMMIDLKIWLEADSESVVEELKSVPAQYRRMYADMFRAIKMMSYSEINVGNGRERLKGMLLERANRYVYTGKIVAVHFERLRFHRRLPGQ